MHLFELRAANRARQAEWPGNDQIDKSFRTIEVAGEGGEIVEALTGLLVTAIHGLGIASGSGKVAERVKKLLRAERGITGSTATLDHLADELADGVVTIELLAEDLGIDLDAAVVRKFNATSEKYGLKTRLDPQSAVLQWQTMESAPTDGREILLQVEQRAGIPGKCLVGHYMPGGHCIDDHPPIDEGWYFWNGCMFDKASKPIKWCVLPATEQTESEAHP